MVPNPDSENLSPPAGARDTKAVERASIELLEGLLDLTLNLFTALNEVGGRELRPAATVRRLLKSLRDFPRPQDGSMSDWLRAAVVTKRGHILTEIARQATVTAKRLGRDHSPPSAALHDLWRRVGALASLSAELDLRTLSSELNAAMSGPLRGHVGHGDPVRFRDDILKLMVGGEAERTRVLKQWTAQIARTWSPKNPRVRQSLLEARQPTKLKRDAIYAGLFEAVIDSDQPQRLKLGKQWVKDGAQPISHPGPMRVRPARYLTRWIGPEQYWLWLCRRAIAEAEKYVLDLPDDKLVEEARRFERGLRTVRLTPESPRGRKPKGRKSPEPHAPIDTGARSTRGQKAALQGFLGDAGLQAEQAPDDEAADEVGTEDLMTLLEPSDQQRQILETFQRPEVSSLPVRGQRSEVARLTGIPRKQVDAHLSKLMAKAKKRGIRPPSG